MTETMAVRPHCFCGRFTPKEDGKYLQYCSQDCWEDGEIGDTDPYLGDDYY